MSIDWGGCTRSRSFLSTHKRFTIDLDGYKRHFWPNIIRYHHHPMITELKSKAFRIVLLLRIWISIEVDALAPEAFLAPINGLRLILTVIRGISDRISSDIITTRWLRSSNPKPSVLFYCWEFENRFRRFARSRSFRSTHKRGTIYLVTYKNHFSQRSTRYHRLPKGLWAQIQSLPYCFRAENTINDRGV